MNEASGLTISNRNKINKKKLMMIEFIYCKACVKKILSYWWKSKTGFIQNKISKKKISICDKTVLMFNHVSLFEYTLVKFLINLNFLAFNIFFLFTFYDLSHFHWINKLDSIALGNSNVQYKNFKKWLSFEVINAFLGIG